MDLSNRGTFIIFIVLLALGVALLGAIVYILVIRKKKAAQAANGQMLVQLMSPVTSSRFILKPFVTGNQDNSTWSYSAVLKLSKFQSEKNYIVLMTRGQSSATLANQSMILILDGNSSSMYVAFRKQTDPASIQTNTPYMAEGANDVIKKNFCVFKISDVPFFRFFSLHVLYDFNNGVANVYLDGNIVSVCTLYECTDIGLVTHRGDSVSVGFQLPNSYTTGDTLANVPAWNGIEFRKLKVSNKLISIQEIKDDATKYIANVYAQIRKEAAVEDKCDL
jgi:cbb3-type cytochrome oxidase subunit 3